MTFAFLCTRLKRVLRVSHLPGVEHCFRLGETSDRRIVLGAKGVRAKGIGASLSHNTSGKRARLIRGSRGAKTMIANAAERNKLIEFEETTQLTDLGAISLFGAFSAEQREKFTKYLEVRQYQPGEAVFSRGELPSAIYVLLAGNIDLVVEKDFVTQIQRKFRPGQTFGESAFLGIQPHVGKARVASPEQAHVLVITRDTLLELQAEDQNLFALLMMNLAREVSRKYLSMLDR